MLENDEFNPWRRFLFAPLPYVVLECRSLTPGAKLCYARLMAFAGQNGEAWPTVAVLADALGVSERHARRYLAELRDRGFIRVYDRRHEGKASVYTFLRHAALSDKKPPAEFVEEDDVLYEDEDVEDPPDISVRRGDHRTDLTRGPGRARPGVQVESVRSSLEEIHRRDPVNGAVPRSTPRDSGSHTNGEANSGSSARGPAPKAYSDPSPLFGENRSRPSGTKGAREPAPRLVAAPKEPDLYADMGWDGEEHPRPLARAPGRTRAGGGGLYDVRVGRAQDVVQGVQDALKKQASANFVRRERAKQSRANLASDGFANAPASDRAEIRALEQLWRDEFAAVFPTLTIAKWSGKENGQARELLTKYGGKVTVNAVRYVIREWSRIRDRYFKGQGNNPTLGSILKFHDAWVPESENWARHEKTLSEWSAWFEKNPDDPYPPEELKEKYEAAKKELAALGFK